MIPSGKSDLSSPARPPAVEARIPNHWTAKEVPECFVLNIKSV